MDAHTWSSDVNSYPLLDAQLELGPTYAYEYNTRETYGQSFADVWPADAPLNATWWHKVTEAMEADHSLVERFNTLQGKSSVYTKPCTGACIEAKICYIRSGSAPLGKRCPQGHGSVQN
jgi:sphingomyelin phosphodiesterase